MSNGCGAPEQTTTDPDTGAGDQTVLTGTVTDQTGPLGGAYVRLLDAQGDFAGEVQASAEGVFRFYASAGNWTVRALHRSGRGEASVHAPGAGVHRVTIPVS